MISNYIFTLNAFYTSLLGSYLKITGYLLIAFFLFIFPVQVNVRVVHTPDTSVVIHPLDQSDNKPHGAKTLTRLPPQTHKPKGRCFQETTPKQAVSDRSRWDDTENLMCPWIVFLFFFNNNKNNHFNSQSFSFCSVVVTLSLVWPIRKTAVEVWVIPGAKINVTNALYYLVSSVIFYYITWLFFGSCILLSLPKIKVCYKPKTTLSYYPFFKKKVHLTVPLY